MQGFGRLISGVSLLLVACGAPEGIDVADKTVALTIDPDAENEGMVEISWTGKSDSSTTVVENVGGGTWSYGREGTYCWSNYVHNSKRHSATVIWGSRDTKVFANATLWARASLTGGSGTCRAYWNTY